MVNFKKSAIIAFSIFALSGCSGKQHKTIGMAKTVNNEKGVIAPLEKPLKLERKKSFRPQRHNAKNSYLLNPNKSLEIEISEFGYTRFSLEDERITDVFVYPQEGVQLQIHKQGYLIVVPKDADELADENSEPALKKEGIYLTVTGEEGTTQDFSLRFTGKEPEPVRFIKSGNN